MFMPTFLRFVKFSYIKNDTLFFVLNHNAGKQEFDNSIQNIKKALNLYAPKECEELAIKDIKAFITHTQIQETQVQVQKVQKYPERSSGEFSINIQDSHLNSLVQSIQRIIKEKNAASK
jgi:preprotein translocase subunit Sec63